MLPHYFYLALIIIASFCFYFSACHSNHEKAADYYASGRTESFFNKDTEKESEYTPIRALDPSPKKWEGICLSKEFALLLCDDNIAYVTGKNTAGQFPQSIPVHSYVNDPAPFEIYSESYVSAGYEHILLLRSDNAREGIRCKGGNTHGQCAIDSKNSNSVDRKYQGSFVRAEAGGQHSLLIDERGKLYGMGNSLTSVIDPSHPRETYPWKLSTPLIANHTFDSAAAGWKHSIFLTDSGRVFTLGFNSHGQLGDGSFNDHDQFVEITLNDPLVSNETVVAICAGHLHSVLLTSSGRVFAAGDNTWSQLGISSSNISAFNTFHAVDGLPPIELIACGHYHNIFLSKSNILYGVGLNTANQVAQSLLSIIPTPIRINTTQDVIFIAAGASSTAYLSASRSLHIIGDLYPFGHAPMNTAEMEITMLNSTEDILRGELDSQVVRSISTGGHHTLLLFENDAIVVSGRCLEGQIGLDGPFPTTAQLSPWKYLNADYFPSDTTWSLISAGEHYSMLLSTSGSLFCMGSNSMGQCCMPKMTTSASTPSLIRSPVNDGWMFVSAGSTHAVLISAKGVAYSCGDGQDGKLGVGDTENRYEPTPILLGGVLNGTSWAMSAASASHTILLSTDGIAYAFGNGRFGKLGLGDEENRLIPSIISIESLKNITWRSISAGKHHTIFLSTNGVAYTAGRGDQGALGTGDANNRLIPTAVSTQTATSNVSWDLVSAGDEKSLFLTNGQVYSCGDNESFIPLPIQQGSEFAQVDSSFSHQVFLSMDRERLFFSGMNNYCQMGFCSSLVSYRPQSHFSEPLEYIQSHNISLYASSSSKGTVLVSSSNTKYSVFIKYGSSTDLPASSDPFIYQSVAWPKDKRIVFASMASHTAVVITEEGDAYATGDNRYHQACVGNSRKTSFSSFTKVQCSDGDRVCAGEGWKQVSLTKTSTAFLSASGKIYTCGIGEYGELARGKRTSISHDLGKAPSASTMIFDQVSAGEHHLIARSTNGAVYTVGCYYDGRLGREASNHFWHFVRVRGFTGTAKYVAAGSAHNLILDTDGRVFSFGKNDNKQLCLPSIELPSISKPTHIFYKRDDAVFSDISAGAKHTLLLLNSGEALACGSNEHGALGVGEEYPESVGTPTSVPLNATVHEIIGGHHFSLFLSNSTYRCPRGFFMDTEHSACEPCKPGHYCLSDKMRFCPLGTWSHKQSTKKEDCSAKLCKDGQFCGYGNLHFCPEGEWRSSKEETCTPCDINFACANGTRRNCAKLPYYSNGKAGNSVCSFCPAGSYVEDSSQCVLCSKGLYCPGDGLLHPCPRNEYSPIEGASNCSICPIGNWLNADATNCFPCDPGYYCPDPRSRIECEEGTYTDQAQQISCKICSPGSFVKHRKECILCGKGSYCDGAKSRTCPKNSYSENMGSKSKDDCEECSSEYTCINGQKHSRSDSSDTLWVVTGMFSAALAILFLLSVCCVTICAIIHFRTQRRFRPPEDSYHKMRESELQPVTHPKNRPRIVINEEFLELDLSEVEYSGTRIGEGTSSIVHKCTWKRRIVAVKTYKVPFGNDATRFYDSFQREGSIMASIRHPNVVDFLGCILEGDFSSREHDPDRRMAIVMEYCPTSLADLIASQNMKGMIPLDRINILIEISQGMDWLHQHKIVHRDLKPENILISSSSVAKISDFGLARQMNETSRAMTGCVGTPPYISPEIVLSNSYDAKCDVFSFGMMAWEVITSTLNPFEETNWVHLNHRIATNPDCRPSLNRPEFVEGSVFCFMAPILRRCWHEDAGMRPTFAELIDTFTEWKEEYSSKP